MPFHFDDQKIGLALSGGGFRATVFHAGVLKWMSERDCLTKVAKISSVSGGSLFTGLVFKFSGYRWPTSQVYQDSVYPQIRDLLTSTSLQTVSLKKLFFDRSCWKYALRRGQIISKCLESLWGIKATLGDLPKRPAWTINGTTAENGKRFRFEDATMGDYRVGYADAPNYNLATAMAVSAAFPGGIGPVRIETGEFKWRNGKADPFVPPFKRLHLYDGGVYDNLGLESLFDIGSQEIKIKRDANNPTSEVGPINFIMVSDAGAIQGERKIPGPLNPMRLTRVIEVAFDQCRALRVRPYVNYLKNHSDRGMYFQIGYDPNSFKYEKERNSINYKWLSPPEIARAANYPTHIKRMTKTDFDRIASHGYETALANDMFYLK